MRLLDKIMINRLISILTTLVIAILKFFSSGESPENPDDQPREKKRVPWLKRRKKS